MGRGLSDLQRWILKRSASVFRLHQAQIFFERFGWEPRSRALIGAAGYTDAKAAGGETFRRFFDSHVERRAYGTDWFFSARRIGPKYDSTMAAVSRSIRRLEQRGLVIRRFGRILITAAGLAWCRANYSEHDPPLFDYDRGQRDADERAEAVRRVCQKLGRTAESLGIG